MIRMKTDRAGGDLINSFRTRSDRLPTVLPRIMSPMEMDRMRMIGMIPKK